MEMDRIVTLYEGSEPGPLFICFGGMHGNEPAGIKAMDIVGKMLEVEPIRNPHFKYHGQFVGLIGNQAAYRAGQRFLDKDLNRNFSKVTLEKAKSQRQLDHEDREFLSIDRLVRALIEKYEATKLIVLDLHTTSSHGGIFTICRDEAEDIKIASALHAPIVLGMLKGLKGTTLHYFITENMGIETIPITFESGQHEEGLSVNRAVAGIINCMKAIGAVEENVVENHHEKILIEYSKDLPKVTELISRHPISDTDNFVRSHTHAPVSKAGRRRLFSS